MNFPLKARLAGCCLLLASTLMVQAFEWTGAAGPGFRNVGSWTGGVPAADSINEGDLLFSNETAPALEYSSAEGTTVFNCIEFKVGNSKKPAGSLLVSGGNLTINARQSPIVGQNNMKTSKLTVTGGSLTVNSRPDTSELEARFRVGNGFRGTEGIMEITGGLVTINCPGTPTESGFAIASGPANGRVILSGTGRLEITNPNGTTLQPSGSSSGVGVLHFGAGNGVFVQTASAKITFGESAGGKASHINFESGSQGSLVLTGAEKSFFDELVKTRKIRIDSHEARPEDFAFSAIGGMGIYRLAAGKK